jgi:hypothetical protein
MVRNWNVKGYTHVLPLTQSKSNKILTMSKSKICGYYSRTEYVANIVMNVKKNKLPEGSL